MLQAGSIIALIMWKRIVKYITVSNRCENLQILKFAERNFTPLKWEK